MNPPHHLEGYRRHITSDQLPANHPYYPETQNRSLRDDVTIAFGDRCTERLIEQISDPGLLSEELLLEALICLEECISNQETRVCAVDRGLVRVLHPLLLRQCHAKQGSTAYLPNPQDGDTSDGKREDSYSQQYDAAAPNMVQPQPMTDHAQPEEGFSFGRNSNYSMPPNLDSQSVSTALSRRGWMYIAGRNAKTPIDANTERPTIKILQGQVLKILSHLSSQEKARLDMHHLGVWKIAGDYLISESDQHVMYWASELLAHATVYEGTAAMLVSAGSNTVPTTQEAIGTKRISNLWLWLKRLTLGRNYEDGRVIYNAAVTACSVAQVDDGRQHLQSFSVVPASCQLLAMALEGCKTITERFSDGQLTKQSAVDSYHGGISNTSDARVVLQTSRKLLELLALLCKNREMVEMALSSQAIPIACSYTKLLWNHSALEPLHLLIALCCDERGRECLTQSLDFLQMIPLLVDGTMIMENVEAKEFHHPLAPSTREQRTGIGGLVLHLLRSACCNIEFQHKMFRILRSNEDIVHMILGEAAALPAASLLDESLRIMQTEEGKARAYDVEDYHMEWIQHALETDAVFLEGHTAATQALSLIHLLLRQPQRGTQGGESAALWAIRYIPGFEGLLKRAMKIGSLKYCASECLLFLRAAEAKKIRF